VSTLLCQVRRRLPVAVVDLYGTFDESSAVGGVITLRECLADQPLALVLDVTHVSVVGGVALSALLELAHSAARWPGARIALCGAGQGASALMAAGRDGEVDLYRTVDEAMAAALKLPVPPRRAVELAPDRHAPEQARSLVNAACLEFGVARLAQLAQIIVSELVTNAVVHARTPIEVTARLADSTLDIAVRDGDPRLLVDAGGGAAADGYGYGRGLLIVDTMADTWGCAPTGDGKVVWARLTAPAPG
jgi:anti-sigma regulatory factor (Ser/Thr protein kinase)/anti-anti-sigma regulatory factor